MAGILKVDKYQDFNGNDIMTSDGSGNITLSTNMTTAVQAAGETNTPAFEAYLSGNQDLTDSTATKVQFDTEQFDTDSMYDNTTNYRFTPTVAGKYLCYSTLRGGNDGASTLNYIQIKFYKNGSAYQTGTTHIIHFVNNPAANASLSVTQIIEFNGTTDYLEVYGVLDTTVNTPQMGQNSIFGAMKIIE